jgi:hypothetical protein
MKAVFTNTKRCQAVFLLSEIVGAAGPSFLLTNSFLATFSPPGIMSGYWELFHRHPSYRTDALSGLETLVVSLADLAPHFVSDFIWFPCLALDAVDRWSRQRSHGAELTEEYNGKTMTFEGGGWTQKAGLRGPLAYRRYRSAREPHLPRTLDEDYYPGLGASDFLHRNMDQVVTKEPWRRARMSISQSLEDESFDEGGQLILLIPQLWIWKAQTTVISAYSMSDGSYGYEYSNAKCHRPWDGPFVSAQLCIARMLRRHVQGFELTRTIQGRKTRPVLDIYENYVVLIVSEVDRYTKFTKSSEFSLETERRLLHDVSDVQEELVMITGVLDRQSDVMHSFVESFKNPDSDANKDAKDEIIKAIQMLGSYKARISKIQFDAERVEKSVKDMLELKRAHASITDAHHSLLLSTAVMGFTVVTIIFAPLAFLTALFALKLDSFVSLYAKEADGSRMDGVYDSGKLGGILGMCTSFVQGVL